MHSYEVKGSRVGPKQPSSKGCLLLLLMLLYCYLKPKSEGGRKDRDHGTGTQEAAAQCKPGKRTQEDTREERRGGSVTVETAHSAEKHKVEQPSLAQPGKCVVK